jgi:hypothetical protein
MADSVFYETVAAYGVTQLRQSACEEFDADFGSIDVHSAGEPHIDFTPLQFPQQQQQQQQQQRFDDHHHHRSYHCLPQQHHYHYQPDGTFANRDASAAHDATRHTSPSTPNAYPSSYGYSYPTTNHYRGSMPSEAVSNTHRWATTAQPYSIQDGYRSVSPSSSSSEQLHGLCDMGDIYRTEVGNYIGRGGAPECGVGARRNASALAHPPFSDYSGSGISCRQSASAGNQTSMKAEAVGLRRTAQRDGKMASTARLEIYPWMMESRQSAEKLHRQQQQKQLMAVLPGELATVEHALSLFECRRFFSLISLDFRCVAS